MDNEYYKNLLKQGEGLQSKQKSDTITKIMIILLAFSFLVVIIAIAATSLGVKSPSYQQGYVDGFRSSYQAGFDSSIYNVKTGLGKDTSYNDGYQHGYDDGYPAGQLDHNKQILNSNMTTNMTVTS